MNWYHLQEWRYWPGLYMTGWADINIVSEDVVEAEGLLSYLEGNNPERILRIKRITV